MRGVNKGVRKMGRRRARQYWDQKYMHPAASTGSAREGSPHVDAVHEPRLDSNLPPPPRQWLTPEPEEPVYGLVFRNPNTNKDFYGQSYTNHRTFDPIYGDVGFDYSNVPRRFRPTHDFPVPGTEAPNEASAPDGPAHLSIGQDPFVQQPYYPNRDYAPPQVDWFNDRELENNWLPADPAFPAGSGSEAVTLPHEIL
jgi:hypothetical protein